MTGYLSTRLEQLDRAYNPSPTDPWTLIKSEISEAMEVNIPRRITKEKTPGPEYQDHLHNLIKNE